MAEMSPNIYRLPPQHQTQMEEPFQLSTKLLLALDHSHRVSDMLVGFDSKENISRVKLNQELVCIVTPRS